MLSLFWPLFSRQEIYIYIEDEAAGNSGGVWVGLGLYRTIYRTATKFLILGKQHDIIGSLVTDYWVCPTGRNASEYVELFSCLKS